MPFYIVFGASTQESIAGRSGSKAEDKRLVWWPNPVGVFRSDTADDACKKAAQKTGRLATFAAVDCTPWGITMLEVDGAYELGDPLEEADAKIQETENRLRALERQNDDAYHKVTKDLDDLEANDAS